MTSTSSQDQQTRLLQCGILLTRHCFTASPITLAVTGMTSTLRITQIRLLRCGIYSFTTSAHSGFINSVAVTGDDKYIISGSDDKTIAVWDIANKTLLHRFQEAHSDSINSVAVTGDDKYIISGSGDKTIAVWDIANKTLLHRFQEAHSFDNLSGGDRR